MTTPIRILLQTTIPESKDDWSVDRFSLLRGYLASLTDGSGNAFVEVTARNRESDENGDDLALRVLDRSAYDELWLFAVDAAKRLTAADCAGITRFRQRGGGILLMRNHQHLARLVIVLHGRNRSGPLFPLQESRTGRSSPHDR
jgi:hypothetical protein